MLKMTVKTPPPLPELCILQEKTEVSSGAEYLGWCGKRLCFPNGNHLLPVAVAVELQLPNWDACTLENHCSC